jgi:hypothetical protein
LPVDADLGAEARRIADDVLARCDRDVEATGISAPIDRLTFLRGRITSEEPCPPKARVKAAGAKSEEERVL